MPKETKKEEAKKEASTPTSNGSPTAKDLEENKAITFLSYLWLLSIIPLLTKKDSKFAQFHAKQGLVLAIIWTVASWLTGIIPFIGPLLLFPIITIAGIILSIMGLLNVAKGEMKELPVIGDIVKKAKI